MFVLINYKYLDLRIPKHIIVVDCHVPHDQEYQKHIKDFKCKSIHIT